MKTAWPNTTDLAAMYTSQGLTAPDSSVLTDTLNAAVQWWEEKTGYKPWLADTEALTDETVTFDPPENYDFTLDLQGGFYSVASVKFGVAYNVSGTTLVANRDYQLLPLEANAKRRPFTRVRFLTNPGRKPASIQVIGRRGYWNEIEEDVWLAVRNWAFAQSVTEIVEGYSFADELTQGPVKIKYGNAEGQSKIDRYKNEAAKTAARYMRIDR